MNCTPFQISVPDNAVADLRRRLRQTRIADDFGNQNWRFGVERNWLSGMLEYWGNDFDWRAQEAAINAFPHYRTEIDGVTIHFVHVRGNGPRPMPLLLTHGWPWTFWDWKDVIWPLTDPAASGGDARDAFDVIIPSLPGFAFSSPLARSDLGVRAIGGLWLRLMRDVIGEPRFMAAGGDWGSLVSAELGHAYPGNLAGVHLTLPLLPGIDPKNLTCGDFAEDEAWMVSRMAKSRTTSSSHIAVHRASPQTLAYAFDDSPAGLAAWIWERRRNWSDCGGDIDSVFEPDFLCTTASLYWFTRTIGTSMRLYSAHQDHPWTALTEDERTIPVPTAFAIAPGELAFIPRGLAERRTNLARWTVFPAGGHFLPVEAPGILVNEYRAFARALR